MDDERIVAQVDQALASLESAIEKADELGDIHVSRVIDSFNCLMGRLVKAYEQDPGNGFLVGVIGHALRQLAGEVE